MVVLPHRGGLAAAPICDSGMRRLMASRGFALAGQLPVPAAPDHYPPTLSGRLPQYTRFSPKWKGEKTGENRRLGPIGAARRRL